MVVLGIILSRAGSKGLPDKCLRALRGRPVITHTFDHARAATRLSAVVLTTDSDPAKQLAHQAGIEVVDRPAELATDHATVDAAARHAVEAWESAHGRRADAVVLLYGNIPVRAPGVIDRAVAHLIATGADSVRTVAPVSKQHPDWIHRLDGDRMIQFRANGIYRRQDLEPLYYHDGAVAAVTRAALFAALETPDDHQSFLGRDRRAIVQACEDAVDIDAPIDLHLAEALLAAREWPAAPTTVDIDGRPVGPGRRAMIVAEAGVNHDGDPAKAMRLVDAAVQAGADAVKFQVFRAADLATAAAPTAEYQRDCFGDGTQRDMLARIELSSSDFSRIREHCEARGIRFLATPFSPSDVDRLLEWRPAAIKIASTDLNNGPLLRRAADTKLPIIVSTGAATASEIDRAIALLRSRRLPGRLILLHCVSSYPTPLDAANLRAIRTLAEASGVPCGLSDHTESAQTGGWAVAAGACLIEKHITLDRTAAGPDHAMSLEPDAFAEFVANVRQVEAALGTGALGMNTIEADTRRVARRSIVAAGSISAGDVVTEAMLAMKRPAGGIDPAELDRLVGRRARVDIPADATLSWDMVE
jgi:N-acetylneuraminate synthase/N,N'-diacetyllegionaminate synthase